MKVRLIAKTTPIDEEANLSDFIAFVARVSNPSNQNNKETSGKLLKYLIDHKHWSPFEMASICMEITTTRDIARQILRHRSFSFQEFSQRYAVAASPLVFREARFQDTKNRQNSIEVTDEALQNEWKLRQQDLGAYAKLVYMWALDNNIAKEVARSVLPEGLTESVLYMSGTVRSWIHYTDLRTGPETQKEHREIALECKRILDNEL